MSFFRFLSLQSFLSTFLAAFLLLMVIGLSTTPARAGTGTAGDPYLTLTEAYFAPSSGRYFFNLGSGLFQADVDTSEGGGWVLVTQYVHQANTNPPLTVIGAGANLPETSAAALGADESTNTARWGHAGNAAMSQFTGDIETRWFARTSGNPRIIHFRTSIADDYFRTGIGSMAGVNNAFTALSGHTAQIPATAVNIFADQGDEAFTNFPFWLGGARHWGIRGLGNRWEVDDFANGPFNSTIHRIWVRNAVPGTVTTTSDSGTGSLRDAIDYSNRRIGPDTVRFNIPGVGPHSITLTSVLPGLTDSGTTIDGTTQAGASCGDLWAGTPHVIRVQLDGVNASFVGITSAGANQTIRGLSLTRFRNAILARAVSTNAAIQCNYIGLTPAGAIASNSTGVLTFGAGTIIGGLTAGQGNVISGNNPSGIISGNGATAMSVRGNFIGTDPLGLAARGNTAFPLSNNTGTASWSDVTRNLISGNGSNGIGIQGDDIITPSAGSIRIVGNYIGVNRTGNSGLPNAGIGIDFTRGTANSLTIGGTNLADRNIISSNISHGIALGAQTGYSILGNYIGLNSNGTATIGNGGSGISINDTRDVVIGSAVAGGRNVISGNGRRSVEVSGTAANITLNSNYIGTDATGNVAVTNGVNVTGALRDALAFNGVASTGNLSILNNVIGGYTGSQIEFVTVTANNLTITGNKIGVGANGTSQIISNTTEPLIVMSAVPGALSNVKIGGTAPGEGNVLAFGDLDGIFIGSVSNNMQIVGNTIRNNARAGVLITTGTTSASIYQNSIFNNGGLGIDLGTGGVNPNDAGDGDSGPNNLLNFPTLTSINAVSGSALRYRFNLDAPADANGYRIDFYKNSAADPSGFGEGEIWLGFISTGNHAGGSVEYIGTLTTLEPIAIGDIISTTTTRRTAGGSFDISSEFSAVATADGVAQLAVTITSEVYEPLANNPFATPSNDILLTSTFTNIGSGVTDTDSIFAVISINQNNSLFNDVTAELGGVIGFSTNAPALTFTPATDLRFSDSVTAPTSFAQCSYTPASGYDPLVRHICLNPKGTLPAGDPDGQFVVRLRAQID